MPVDAKEEMLNFYDSSMSSYNRLQLVVFENGLENTNLLEDGNAIMIEINVSDQGRKYNSYYIAYLDISDKIWESSSSAAHVKCR